MQPEALPEVREWLERAAEDLREAEHDLAAVPPLVRGSVFHSQQAAEKALKAFLVGQGQTFPWTHDLDVIGGLVTGLDPGLAAVVDRARNLTPYAWRFRYPGAPMAPTDQETRDALAVAREVYDAIVARSPESARP